MSYELGFETLDHEVQLDRLPMEGRIPEWLSGTLVRNGPARFEIGDQSYNHWFDGLAMLHAFQFEGGEVAYANRFLESGSYRDAEEAGEIVRGEFGTDPCRSIFKRVMQILWPPDLTDNANINVAQMADAYVAMTETPAPIAFDPEMLTTEGYFEYDDDVEGDITTAHPHVDPERETIYNYLTVFGRTSSYRIYAQPTESRTREMIAEIDVETPRYMHSFGATRRHVVLVEFPVVMYPLQLLLGDESFAEHMSWEPERGTRIRVVDKETGELVTTETTDPFFAFHHVNAFEADGEIVLDIVAYPDTEIVQHLYLDELRDEPDLLAGELQRLRFDLEGGRVHREPLFDHRLELPRIHPDRAGADYRYVWSTGQSPSASFTDEIAKFDLETHRTSLWRRPDCYPGEPVFVERPGAEAEDDGVLLSVVLDAEDETSFLLVLDAASLEELGRARVPHHVPFGFHGQYFE
jgi:carotenoid cleavage dioxygenase-like enzyme